MMYLPMVDGGITVSDAPVKRNAPEMVRESQEEKERERAPPHNSTEDEEEEEEEEDE